MRSVIKRTAKEENQEFLIQNGSYQNFANKHWYWGLLLTVFEVVVLLKYEQFYTVVEGYEETSFSIFLSILFALFFVVHGVVGAIGVLFVICAWGDEKRSPLEVRDFLSAQEISIMRLVNTQMRERTGIEDSDENDYRREGGMAYWRVHSPDEFVPVMKEKKKLLEYHAVQMKLYRMEDVDKDLLTPEQVKRNEEFEQQFHESLIALEPHLEQIKRATDKAYFKAEQKRKLNKSQIRQDFDEKQADAERALMVLSESEPVHEAIRELRRVAGSKLVSMELKEEANSLLERIEEKQSEAKNQQQREMVDRDAVAIIRANELFYGVNSSLIEKTQE